MKNMMEYQDYFGSVNFSDEDEVFFGKVEFIRSLISYEGTNVQSLKSAFHEAVDEYLYNCAKNEVKPERPFKENFNIRPGTQLHRRAAIAA